MITERDVLGPGVLMGREGEIINELRRRLSNANETLETFRSPFERWRTLEHGCQWVSFTPIGGETLSFDPRTVPGLVAMRAFADETFEKHLAILKASLSDGQVPSVG